MEDVKPIVTNEPLAHLTKDGIPHFLIDHLKEVARLASLFAVKFNKKDLAYVIGFWHDLGKYSNKFQRKIREANGFESHLEDPEGTKPDHSTAGAVHANNSTLNYLDKISAVLCIAGHHTGLKNYQDVINNRVKNKDNGVKKYATASEIFKDYPEITGYVEPNITNNSTNLEQEFITRMMFSALVDADWSDTEAFYDPNKSNARGSDYKIPELLDALKLHMDKLSANAIQSKVNVVRASVLKDCWNAASNPPGAFSLTVPTGGGKTLASIAFALTHAAQNNLERVIVVVPFVSIIEQTAQVYKNIFGNDAVLEHHSAFDSTNETWKSRLATDNWDAPIIVTTNVQLLESLFSNRTSACRKVHRMAKSVIVFDEAQALPCKYLDPIMCVLNSLISQAGSSIVISTATQPALNKSKYCTFGFENSKEIISNVNENFADLKRVNVTLPDVNKKTSYVDLAKSIAKHNDALAIVHLRADAITLVNELDSLGVKGVRHLSALMCGKHRTEVIAKIKSDKKAGEPVILVATQLIEAGVDVDFAVVYRALGGLDSMAQAAGRCNREGKMDAGEFIMFYAESNPPSGVPRTGLDIAKKMIRMNPNLDLFDQQTYEKYFSQMYYNNNCDEQNIQKSRKEYEFETVAEQFKLIDDSWSAPLVVRYKESNDLIKELEKENPSHKIFRKLQRYTVNVSKNSLESWIKDGLVVTLQDSVNVVHEDMAHSYDDRFGFMPTKMKSKIT